MITIYHVPSARSTRSLWLLNELGIDFDLVEMPFDLKYLRAPEYLAVHPLGRVPCLVDDGQVIFESGAICQYLCERYDDGKLGRGPGHPERYEWLQWIHYAETVAVHGASLVQQAVFIAEQDRSPVVQKLEGRRLEKAVEVLDNHLKDRDYILASGFSAADTSIGFSIYLGRQFISLDTFSNVGKYMACLRERPAFNKSFPAGD